MLAAIIGVALVLRLGLYLWLARGYGGIDGTYFHFDCSFYLRIAESGYGSDSHFHGFVNIIVKSSKKLLFFTVLATKNPVACEQLGFFVLVNL